VFRHYNDNKFKKIVDEYILSSVDDQALLYALKNIDFQSRKFGIPFYQMIFILIQEDLIDNRKKKD
jgi:hypothetical protein